VSSPECRDLGKIAEEELLRPLEIISPKSFSAANCAEFRSAVAALKRFDVVVAITLNGDATALAKYELARTVRYVSGRKEVTENSTGSSPASEEAAAPVPATNAAAA
jgi:hypothetical protein